jgi:Ferric reductase NAD binding domain.
MDVTKVRITSPRIKKWSPGQHVFFVDPKTGIGSITPGDDPLHSLITWKRLVFILRAHRGFTQRLLRSAKSSSTDLSPLVGEKKEPSGKIQWRSKKRNMFPSSEVHMVDLIPISRLSIQSFLSQDPLVLHLLYQSFSILRRGQQIQKLPVRRLVFAWVIRSIQCKEWISTELNQAINILHDNGIEIEVRLFVTCEIDSTGTATKNPGCKCRNVEGPCCCCDLGTEKPKAASRTFNTSLSDEPDIESSSSVRLQQTEAKTSTSLPAAYFTTESGRPQLKPLLWDLLDHAQGETGVAVCGPPGLVSYVRNTVATVSEQRGSSKGTGAEGIYLHAENFAW